MSRVRSEDTEPEMTVRRLVHAMGYRYRLHARYLPGKPDLVLPRLRKVVFVHGCFWHQHCCKRGNRRPASRQEYWLPKLERNVKRDRKAVRDLRKLGWRTLVVWECQTRAKKRPALAERIARFLAESS
jgi:DNA mismatch endonuclease (patch repair protein)